MSALFAVAATLLVFVGLPIQAPAVRRLPAPGTQMHDVSLIKASPSSVITFATRYDYHNVHTLALMVVWRGTGGWHARESAANSSGGTAERWFEYTVRSGDVALKVRFEALTRIAEIQGSKVAVRANNVILVDNVDSASGPRVVRMLRIDPSVATAPDGFPLIEHVWMRSPEIVSFVKR